VTRMGSTRWLNSPVKLRPSLTASPIRARDSCKYTKTIVFRSAASYRPFSKYVEIAELKIVNID
jgi:hypothetical protein